ACDVGRLATPARNATVAQPPQFGVAWLQGRQLNDRQPGREPMARSMRLARGAAWLAILATPALAMAGWAEAAPPYPDTSAVGTVPAMSQKLAVAGSGLDKVEAQLAALRQKSDALTRTQLGRKRDAEKLTAQGKPVVKDWNAKVAALKASYGNHLQ